MSLLPTLILNAASVVRHIGRSMENRGMARAGSGLRPVEDANAKRMIEAVENLAGQVQEANLEMSDEEFTSIVCYCCVEQHTGFFGGVKCTGNSVPIHERVRKLNEYGSRLVCGIRFPVDGKVPRESRAVAADCLGITATFRLCEVTPVLPWSYRPKLKGVLEKFDEHRKSLGFVISSEEEMSITGYCIYEQQYDSAKRPIHPKNWLLLPAEEVVEKFEHYLAQLERGVRYPAGREVLAASAEAVKHRVHRRKLPRVQAGPVEFHSDREEPYAG